MSPVPFRHSVCNAIFGTTAFAEACGEIRKAGYEGVEVAPVTLAEDATALTDGERNEIRAAMQNQDLCFAGLNWDATVPSWLHLTTRDESLRERSWNYLHSTIDLCGDLGVCQDEYNSVIVLGAAQQRSTLDGMTAREATDVLTHGLAYSAPRAESRGVRLIINPLPPDQTDVVTSLEEAVAIVRQVGSPALQTMFDVQTVAASQDQHAELIRRYAPYLHHIHISETDGTQPGTGSYDFAGLFAALSAAKYRGWVSLNVSKSNGGTGAPQVITKSLEFLKTKVPELAFTQTV